MFERARSTATAILLACLCLTRAEAADFQCTNDEKFKFRNQDYVVKAGEELALTGCLLDLNSLTIEEGGKVTFNGRLRVRVGGDYHETRPYRGEEWLGGKQVIFNHACSSGGFNSISITRDLIDKTSDGGFVKLDAPLQTVEQFEACPEIVRPIEIRIGRVEVIYPIESFLNLEKSGITSQ